MTRGRDAADLRAECGEQQRQGCRCPGQGPGLAGQLGFRRRFCCLECGEHLLCCIAVLGEAGDVLPPTPDVLTLSAHPWSTEQTVDPAAAGDALTCGGVDGRHGRADLALVIFQGVARQVTGPRLVRAV